MNRRAFLKQLTAAAAIVRTTRPLRAFANQQQGSLPCARDDDQSRTGKIKRAIDYPYERPATSYLFIQEGKGFDCAKGFQYANVGDDPMSATSVLHTPGGRLSVPEFLRQHGLASDPKSRRTAVIGYGSNPALEQLARKFGNHKDYGPFTGDPVIPVIKAHMQDFDVVYMGHIGWYGAVPATLASSQGTDVVIWLTFLTDDQLVRMDQTESVGSLYDRGLLEGVSIVLENGRPLHQATIYIDRLGALVWDDHLISLAKIEASGRKNLALLESEMLDRLRTRFRPDAQLDEFIIENIEKDTVREARNSSLHKMTRHFSHNAFRVIGA